MRQRTLESLLRGNDISDESESDEGGPKLDTQGEGRDPDHRQARVQSFYGSGRNTVLDSSSDEKEVEESDIVFPRNGAPCTEDGFRRESDVTSGYARQYWRCCHERTIGGVVKRCTHRVRVDYWEKQAPEKRGKHKVHVFEEEQEKDGRNGSSEAPRCLRSAYGDVYRLIARNICTMNISVENGCGVSMMRPIWKAMEICMNGKQSRTPQQLLPSLPREVMRHVIIKEADEAGEDQLRELMGAKNACICLDAGTAGAFHILELIVNHHGREVHLCSINLLGETMNAQNYARKALDALEMCDRFKIEILCFVGDGLPAQKNALNGRHDHAFQKLSQCKSSWKKIFFMPCMLHRINLIIPHAKTQYDWFSSAIASYHDLSVLLRRNETKSWLRERCPLFVATRWVYGYDVVNFIFKHRAEIREWATGNREHCRLVELAWDYKLLYAPMKALVLALSNKGVSLAHVFPCVTACIAKWNDIEFQTNGHVGEHRSHQKTILHLRNYLMIDLSEQTIRSDVGPLLSLAYLLSYRGHHETWFARRSHVDMTEEQKQYITGKPWLDTDRFMSHDIELDQTDTEEEESSQENDIDLSTGDNVTVGGSIDDDDAKRLDFIKVIQEKRNELYLDACKGIELWQNEYRKDTNTLTIDDLKRQLHAWMETPPWRLDFLHLEEHSGLDAWCEVARSKCRPEWAKLAELAEGILSIPASEITCERSLSIQNYICTSRSRRARHDLVSARVKLMQSRVNKV